jgi:dTDP-4-dehydrorhamnose 3,5-epimerase
MNFKETKLQGAFIIAIEPRADERGYFARSWCAQEFEVQGLTLNFVQSNLAVTRHAGTLRGLHYQVYPYEEVKLIRCTRGSIYDVIVDLRPHSPTYKEWIGVELTADNHLMILAPAGFGHGYQTLEKDCEVSYQVSQAYRPDAEKGIRWNDPLFGIEWPISPPRLISEKDKNLPDYMCDIRTQPVASLVNGRVSE